MNDDTTPTHDETPCWEDRSDDALDPDLDAVPTLLRAVARVHHEVERLRNENGFLLDLLQDTVEETLLAKLLRAYSYASELEGALVAAVPREGVVMLRPRPEER